MSKFKPGDRVYYDDNPGTVVRMRMALDEEHDSDRVYEVKWDGGHHVDMTWESDLLSEAEYVEFLAEFGGEV